VGFEVVVLGFDFFGLGFVCVRCGVVWELSGIWVMWLFLMVVVVGCGYWGLEWLWFGGCLLHWGYGLYGVWVFFVVGLGVSGVFGLFVIGF